MTDAIVIQQQTGNGHTKYALMLGDWQATDWTQNPLMVRMLEEIASAYNDRNANRVPLVQVQWMEDTLK